MGEVVAFSALDQLVQRGVGPEVTAEPLKSGDDGGTSGGVTDDWKASVDRQLVQLHGDVRALLYSLIGGFLVLLAGGAAAYVGLVSQIGEARQELSTQLEDGQRDVRDLQTKHATIDGKLDVLIERTPPRL